jgi:hypothetical protein
VICWLILLCKVCAADFAGSGVVRGGVDLVVGRGESEEIEGRGECEGYENREERERGRRGSEVISELDFNAVEEREGAKNVKER